MRFEENPVAADNMISLCHDLHNNETNRAPGLHASDLVFCVRKGYLQHVLKLPKPAPTADQKAMWLSGAGHGYLLQLLGAHEVVKQLTLTHRPGTRAHGHDHIVTTTVDLIEQDTFVGPLICEVKSTRKSYPTGDKLPEIELDYYIEQLATYMLTHRKTTGRLYVMFNNGDYKSLRFPIFRAYDLTLTPQELTDWMYELADRACAMLGANDVPVPLRYGWECGYCEYASKKGGPCTQDELASGRGGDKTGIKQSPFFVKELPVVRHD